MAEAEAEDLGVGEDVGNIGTAAGVEARSKAQLTPDARRKRALSALLATEEGREFLGWFMFDVCGLMAPTANAAFDGNALFFREGARNAALTVQNEMLRLVKPQYMVFISETLHKR